VSKTLDIHKTITTIVNNDKFESQVNLVIRSILSKKINRISIGGVYINKPSLLLDKRKKLYKDLVHIFDSSDYLCTSVILNSRNISRIYGNEKEYLFIELSQGEYKEVYISFRDYNKDLLFHKKDFERLKE